MGPIMAKHGAADLVAAARSRRGVSWMAIAEAIDAPVVWATAALLGQHPVTRSRPGR